MSTYETSIDVTLARFYRENPAATTLTLKAARSVYNRWANNTVQLAMAQSRALGLDGFEAAVRAAKEDKS